jgi:hypothetical protein
MTLPMMKCLSKFTTNSKNDGSKFFQMNGLLMHIRPSLNKFPRSFVNDTDIEFREVGIELKTINYTGTTQ